MYISKLEILGFKSFATPTVLQFGKGITSVIGPNGCGKSNVVDAIRWVLGEQKIHLLRSEHMTDVIFAGSKNRKPLNYAEVSLTIHNDDGILGVAYTEVLVTRRLYRDGNSEYLLNNVPVRLKDIQDLFVDTGMSTDAYSVIELRMVEEILNEDKTKRKHLFEEAAGINKYKAQRKSAKRKLDATKEDLDRLEDIIYEIDNKVKGLRRQLKRYEKYEEYTDELRALETTQAQSCWYEYEDKIAPLEKQLTNDQLNQKETGKQLGIEESMLQTYKQDADRIELKLNEVNQELQQKNEGVNKLNASLLVLQEKTANAMSNSHRMEEEIELARARITANKEIRDRLHDDVGEDNPEIVTLRARLDEMKKSMETARQECDLAEEEFEKVRQTLRGAQLITGETQQRILRLRDNKKQYSKFQEEEISRRKNSVAHTGKQKEQVEGLQAQRDILDREFTLMEAEQGDLEKKVDFSRQKIQEEQQELGHLRTALERNQNECSFYKELVESLEGFNPGIKYVLRHMKHPGNLGVLADLLTVDATYQTAIEIALGNAAKFLVTKTKSDALDIVDELKEKRKGRITAAPLDVIRQRVRPVPQFPYFGNYVIGPAMDYVSASDEVSVLIDYFLGNVILVTSLRELPREAVRDGRFRYVTPDGDFMEQRGMIKGGRHAKAYRQILGRQDKIQELTAASDVLIKDIDTAKGHIDHLRKDEARGKQLLQELSVKSRQQQANRLELEKQVSALSYAVTHQDDVLQEMDEKIRNYAVQIVDLDAQLQESEDNLVAYHAQEEQAAADLEHNKKNYERLVLLRDQSNNSYQDMRIQVISLEKEKDNVKYQYKNAVETIREMTDQVAKLQQEKIDLQETVNSNSSEIKTLELKLEQLKDQREDVRGKRDKVYEDQKMKRDQIHQVEDSISQRYQSREDVFQTLRELEVKLNDYKMRQTQLKQSIFDRFHIDILKKPYEPMDMDRREMDDKIQKLTHRLELIGPINMAVKEEYNEQSTRLTFLKEQLADLHDAENSLEETILKLDTEARKKFSAVFERIRENYQTTYKLFFPQGACDLRLEGSADPLDASVEIFSRPKGREMKSLRALSAGEKALTAIALLFAIYLVKPSPYCILDEVDAPLDDSNIKRFASAVKHFADRTQFIIVTHNKLTMNACDYLYGVTMQEEGVSKIVSVRFTDPEYDNLTS